MDNEQTIAFANDSRYFLNNIEIHTWRGRIQPANRTFFCFVLLFCFGDEIGWALFIQVGSVPGFKMMINVVNYLRILCWQYR